MDGRVERVETESDLRAALAVRRLVFIEGQDVPEHREIDGRDEAATHFLARDGEHVVGTARLRAYDDDHGDHGDHDSDDGTTAATEPGATDDADGDDGAVSTAKVERVAVLAGRRGQGWGARLMDAVEAHAREAGYERVLLHAQVPVVGFYERLGYEVQGEEFMDAGIPHREMAKPL